ncbi:hypothetical protein HanRHA438_Chr16g0770521 [Helianthus annuus]|nr:hypothetical protein HanRHA438_Chr16g0770521 [Helianthus annuus]
MEPHNIHLTIREYNPQNVCILLDIDNVMKKIKHQMHDGHTSMKIQDRMLLNRKYVYYTWERAPHMSMINPTYKKNIYKLLFVQVVGVKSTHKSFCVAHAIVSKGRHDNFLRVL